MNIQPLHIDISLHNISDIQARSNLGKNGTTCWVELTIKGGPDIQHITLFLREGEILRAGRLAQAINQAIQDTKGSVREPLE